MSHATLTWLSRSSDGPRASEPTRLQTILHVQWALAIACAYLVLFGQESGDPHGIGPIVVAGFLATNLFLGRVRPETADRPAFGIVLAAIDAVLIVGSLYLAGQLSVELVLLCLGILILAIAGLRIGSIAVATLGLTLAYLGIVWYTGNSSLWRSSVLLRVPLLFTAAIVYAWLVELGNRGRSSAEPQAAAADPAEALLDEVAGQWAAIQRCQSAMRDGSPGAADEALRDIAAHNQAIRMRTNALR